MQVLGHDADLRSIWCFLMPATLFAELLALGANSPLLSVAAAVLEILTAIAVLALTVPEARFWRGAWPALAILTLMIGWIALPGIAPALAANAPGYAPDMLAPGIARLFGGTAVLIAGAVTGYRPGAIRKAIDAILVLGLLQIVVGLGLREYDPAHVWGLDKGFLVDRFTGTFLNANASGCLFAMIALLGLGRWLAALRLATDTSLSTAASLTLGPLAAIAGVGACAITGSRTTLALLLPALIVVAVRDRELRFRLGRHKIAAATILIAFTATIALLLATIGTATLDRLSSVQADSLGRLSIWRFFGTLAAASPLFGYGPGGFDEAHLHAMRSADQARSLWFVNSAHNEILSLLLFGGWPYLLLMTAAAGWMLAAILRHRRARVQDPLLRSILAALLLMLGCAMDDIALDVPALAALAIYLASLAWGRALRIAAERSGTSDQPRPIPVLGDHGYG